MNCCDVNVWIPKHIARHFNGYLISGQLVLLSVRKWNSQRPNQWSIRLWIFFVLYLIDIQIRRQNSFNLINVCFIKWFQIYWDFLSLLRKALRIAWVSISVWNLTFTKENYLWDRSAICWVLLKWTTLGCSIADREEKCFGLIWGTKSNSKWRAPTLLPTDFNLKSSFLFRHICCSKKWPGRFSRTQPILPSLSLISDRYSDREFRLILQSLRAKQLFPSIWVHFYRFQYWNIRVNSFCSIGCQGLSVFLCIR